MLEIKAIQDKTQQEQICLQLGEEFDIDTLAYSISDSGILLGIVQFALRDGCGVIYNISKSNDSVVYNTEALITAMKTVFNFIDLCGIQDVYFKDERHDEKIVKMFGFNKKDGIWYINLEGFFDTQCHH